MTGILFIRAAPIAPWPSLSLRPQQPIRMLLEQIGAATYRAVAK